LAEISYKNRPRCFRRLSQTACLGPSSPSRCVTAVANTSAAIG